MYQNIAVLLNDLDASRRALECAIDLAVEFDATLHIVTVLGGVPAFTIFPSITAAMTPAEYRQSRRAISHQLHNEACLAGSSSSLNVSNHVVESRDVEAVISLLRQAGTDLLVLGLNQHDYYARALWSGLYDRDSTIKCSVLGVR